MNAEALRQLRRVVRDAPDDLLHMATVVKEAECGTARCAIGWAIIDPWFQQNTMLNEIIPATWNYGCFPNMPVSKGAKATALNKLARLFDIPITDAILLFGTEIPAEADPHCVTKQEVLDNIDRLLAGDPAERYLAAEE